MPRKHKSHNNHQQHQFSSASSPPAADQDETARQSRYKASHVSPQDDLLHDSSPEPSPQEEIAPVADASPRLHPQSSILSQLTHFPQPKTKPIDIRESLAATEKVSDQYTPPSERGLSHSHDHDHDQVDSYGSSPAAQPDPHVVEPGFSTRRRPSHARSPPLSPPQRTVRPVSIGACVSPMPYHHSRYPPSSYGSPPAPHFPQQHFYAPQDIDIGPTPAYRRPGKENEEREQPTFVRFAAPSGSSSSSLSSSSQIMLLGYGRRLAVVAVDADSSREIGALYDLPGTVLDAAILAWTKGQDSTSSARRPLLAVSLHHVDQPPEVTGGFAHSWSTVEVYSMTGPQHLATLLHTAPVPTPTYMPTESPSHLSLQVSRNYLAVACIASGEIFVFTTLKEDSEGRAFKCLGKWWTALQPRIRRDSSYARPPGPRPSRSMPPPDSSRDRRQPIFDLYGRLLVTCPPSNPSLPSVGATLDPSVAAASNSGIEARVAPSRPAPNCAVESPDVETLVGKVARAAALEVVRGAKWLSNQGMNAWQTYWNKDQPASDPSAAGHGPLLDQRFNPTEAYGPFPPTHANDDAESSRESHYVSIYDLQALEEQPNRQSTMVGPVATFEPPKGCSYLSFAPQGLSLLTASRSGDLYYVWDLFQMRYLRTVPPSSSSLRPEKASSSSSSPRVRQLARFDRHSSATVADVVWDRASPSRFAILTTNNTIHLYHLPPSALKWPPPRQLLRGGSIPTSPPMAAADAGGGAGSGSAASPPGFFASAVSLAGKTQPILANWRARSPSTGGGLAGIGVTSLGLASATGAKSSKAVASGLSKSLSTATNAVRGVQQAGLGRLHFNSGLSSTRHQLVWISRGTTAGLLALLATGSQYCPVRRVERQQGRARILEDVFEQKSTPVKSFLPSSLLSTQPASDAVDAGGYWSAPDRLPHHGKGLMHPLSFAEIETNAPYSPFHTDRRVTISIFASGPLQQSQLPTASVIGEPLETLPASKPADGGLLFGDELPVTRLSLNTTHNSDDDDGDDGDDRQATSVYRKTDVSKRNVDGAEQIVVTTRRKKVKKPSSSTNMDGLGDENFFEDDCEVLEFAGDRV